MAYMCFTERSTAAIGRIILTSGLLCPRVLNIPLLRNNCLHTDEINKLTNIQDLINIDPTTAYFFVFTAMSHRKLDAIRYISKISYFHLFVQLALSEPFQQIWALSETIIHSYNENPFLHQVTRF